MIRLLAMGALGYAAFKYLQAHPAGQTGSGKVRLAGGGLSPRASVQADPDTPPATDPYRG